jgi:hypothetical protein
MYTSVSIQKRPNTDINFWSTKIHASKEFIEHILSHYIVTGKLKNSEHVLSDNNLTLTTTITWDKEEDFLKFRQDPVIVKGSIDPCVVYAEEHGIKISSVDYRSNMENVPGPDPYPNLIIPETWNNVEEFGDWWLRSGMPIKFQEGSEVFLSDDATAIALFRKGRFQVELYLIHPHPTVPTHEHPDVEVIKIRLDGKKYPYLSNTLHNGESHGSGLKMEAEDKGYPLLAIQHWLTRDPSTISAMWKGKTVGPLQEALIKRFNPTAFVIDGYADITRND